LRLVYFRGIIENMQNIDKKRKDLSMVITTIVMGVVALILSIIAYSKGQHINGIKVALNMVMQILPLLLFAFIVAGMVKMIIPQELLSKWIGTGSGLKGIFVGTLAGAIAPGGPFVSLPLAAGLLRSGAGIGTMVAFLTAWSLWAAARIPMEIGILGWRFTLIRFASVFFFPPIAGMIAQAIARMIK